MIPDVIPLRADVIPTEIAVIILLELLYGFGYNQLVAYWSKHNLMHVSWTVVIGVAGTLLIPALFWFDTILPCSPYCQRHKERPMNSNPQRVYENLLEELAAGELTQLQRQVFELLRDNPDGLDRYQLVGRIYGYIPLSIEGNTDDRKIRKAIEKMRKRLYPIVSTSGRPGYRLDVSKEAAEKMLAELNSRINHMQEQAEAVSRFFKIPMPKTYRAPRRVRHADHAQQMEMQL